MSVGEEHSKPLVVVDLDGTLIDGNTLKMFARYAFPSNPVRIGLLIVLRKLKLISHRRMKHGLLISAKGIDVEPFIDTLSHHISQEVTDIIKRYPDCEMILATAAPEMYVGPFATKLGVRYVATSETQKFEDYVECRGQEKLRRITALGNKIRAVVTDHHDDLALLSIPGTDRFLINPTPKTEMIVKMSGMRVNIISSRTLM